MTVRKIKELLDACYEAKRIRELLPPLPVGVMPSYIQYLDVIGSLEVQGAPVKISDISDVLHIPRPGVTRTLKEMEAKGYVRKLASREDGRITYISATEKGKQLSGKYDEQYFTELMPFLAGISDEDAECTIRTIKNLYQVMYKRRDKDDK